ncbi:hypothetical protein [Chitinophaga vietnamensis]|uniref:hypothetical protein n=1 Tax=Chitinophaga vietnamensis TaxID=2593957 RepID=UPI0011782048|nr:hypothetical protein [Chitinophaga vietnamensis]
MHNPLVLLSPQTIHVLLDQGYTLFVRQTYPPGAAPAVKESLLITPYKDIGEANLHFQHIRFDKRKYIYESHRPEEMEKLFVAASQPPGYRVYTGWLKDKRWNPPKTMRSQVRRYLAARTNWQNGDLVNAELYLHYGELFLSLQYNQEDIKVPLTALSRM